MPVVGLWTSPNARLDWQDRLPTLPPGSTALDVAFSDAAHGWLITGSTLLRTDDEGSSWRARARNVPPEIFDGQPRLLAPARATVIVLTKPAGRRNARWSYSPDEGRSWTTTLVPESRNGVLDLDAVS